MKDPAFIDLAEVLDFHRLSLEAYGGMDGVRDQNGLESAVYQAQTAYFYMEGDLFDIAAAYAYHIAQSQAFLDGNKRMAVVTSLVFLDRNGINIEPDSMRLYDAMIAIAERRMEKPELAAILRELVVE